MEGYREFLLMTDIRRIVVLGTNWIGDAIMSLAGLRELRRLHPEAHLALVAREWVADIYQDQDLADELIRIPPGLSLLGQIMWTTRRLRSFDLAVVFPNSFVSALQPMLASVPRRVGYATDGRGWMLTARARPRIKRLNRHQVYSYLDLLFQSGLSPLDYLEEKAFVPLTNLRPRPETVTGSARLMADKGGGRRPRVVINPGAFFGPAKRWYPERYAALADRLMVEKAAEIVLIGSAEERDLAEHISNLMDKPPIILTGETSLQDLMGLFSDCELLITNDSGPMHLAAALNTPQIALFGSTDEIATGPHSKEAQIIHKNVSCSPCLLRECPIDLRCFDRILVDEVLSQAMQRLA